MTVPMYNPETGKNADVHTDEVATWKKWGFRTVAAAPLPPPPMADEPTDAELRAAIKAATGTAPGPNTKRETLLAQYRLTIAP